jgi:hypothetical protein
MPSSTDLPTPVPANRPMRWPRPTGQHRVDRAHAGVERLAHRVAVHRVDRAARQRFVVDRDDRALAVHRRAVRVDDAAEQAVADRQVQRAVEVASPRVARLAELHRDRRRGARHDPRAARQAVHVAGRHQVGAVAGEADDFGDHRRLSGHADLADRADRHADAGRLEDEAGDADQQPWASSGTGSPANASMSAMKRFPVRDAEGSRRFDEAGRHAGGCRSGRRRAVVGPRQVAAERGRRASPARVETRIDDADVRLDDAAATRDRRIGDRTCAARASRSPAPSATSAWSSGWTRSVMWRALSTSVSSASCATIAISSGRDCSSLRTAWRAMPGRAGAERLRHLALQPVELLAERFQQSADLQRRLVREGLLEPFERDQAVAVAFLVAGLARLADLLGDLLGRSDTAAAFGGPRRVPAEPGRDRSLGSQAAKAPSSSRGMKRV